LQQAPRTLPKQKKNNRRELYVRGQTSAVYARYAVAACAAF